MSAQGPHPREDAAKRNNTQQDIDRAVIQDKRENAGNANTNSENKEGSKSNSQYDSNKSLYTPSKNSQYQTTSPH